jgi:hypothetical protein
MHPDQAVERALLLKVQAALLEHVLPTLQQTADEIAGFIVEPEDDEENVAALREIAVELMIDELVQILTRDSQPVSKQYKLRDDRGYDIDTLIACYSELQPQAARRWFARRMGLSEVEYRQRLDNMPAALKL